MTTNGKFSGEFTDFEEVKMELSKARTTLKVGKAFQEKNKSRKDLSAQYFEHAKAEIAAMESKIPQLEAILATEPPPPELPPRQPLFKVSGVLEEFSVQKVIGYFTEREYDPEAFASEEERNQIGGLLLAMIGNAAGSAVTGQSDIRQDDRCDFVRGKINGIPFHGWLGKTHVKVGDHVEMAVMSKDDHYLVYAIMLPELRTLSITPRCYCGRKADIRFALIYGMPMISSIFFIILIVFFFKGVDLKFIAFCAAIWGGILFLAFCRAAWNSLKQPGAVFLLAENIFATLGFADPQRVDLRKLTKERLKDKTEDTPDPIGREIPSRRWADYLYYY